MKAACSIEMGRPDLRCSAPAYRKLVDRRGGRVLDGYVLPIPLNLSRPFERLVRAERFELAPTFWKLRQNAVPAAGLALPLDEEIALV